MDFFGEQQAARRNTRWLVLLFALAVAAIIVVLYLVLLGIIGYSHSSRAAQPLVLWQPDLFLGVAAAVSAVIGLASLYKVVQLSHGGGSKVAESLGGRLVSRSSDDALERRLLNVVDEMAIASGIPVPKVYLLDDEHAINAFAAGTSTSDAVVAVTRGTLEQLNRDELQGVVGHEFSHIFNGDMRLNIRLMGVLHGILVLALIGRAILRGGARGRVRVSSSSGKKGGGGGIVVLALALFIIGYIGVFFGRLIKAAVSRQREFLADAAAVQFTRNPAGIAGALKKIAGLDTTRLHHPDAESASHMFFGNGINNFLSLLATHPPVEERIARLDPYFRMEWQGRRQGQAMQAEMPSGSSGFAATASGGTDTAQAVRESVGNYTEQHLNYAHTLLERLPEGVWKSVHEAEGAHALVLALVLVREGDAEGIMHITLPDALPALLQRTLAMVALLKEVPRADWLPLLELAIPALEELPAQRLAAIPDEVDALINADQRVTLFEFSLATLLRHAISERGTAPRPRHHGGIKQIHRDLGQLLSLMAHAGHTDTRQIEAAFTQAAQLIDGNGEIILLPRSELSLKEIEAALQRLSRLNFKFKGKVIEAATTAIMADGEVKLSELELLRAIGASLDCPIPPLQVGVAGYGNADAVSL
ncbi:MAG: M48 family metallopeptidase [Gammaproteobacteria bacterium]|nr:M48 family metallopeptidase [Gammaproteobacteria bacterium]